MADLLPCPFCGGEAKREDIEARDGVENAGASYITCARCWASTALHFDRKEGLYSSWNSRIPVCGYSSNGVNLHGDKRSIDAAFEAFHSHNQIEDLRRNLRHWREECGKLHAKVAEGDHVNDQLRQRLGLGETENERLERVIKKLQADLLAWEITARRIEREEATAFSPSERQP